MSSNRGKYDASSNTFPSADGSGVAGAIMSGDYWFISVAGTLGSENVLINSTVEALTDAPGQDVDQWQILSPEDLFLRKIEAIKVRIADIIQATLPGVLLYRRRVFDADEDQWVGILRGNDPNAPVRTVVVSYRGITRDILQPPATTNPILPFAIVFYRSFELGTDASNAEDELMKDMARCFWRLETIPDLDMMMADDERVRGCVMDHAGLQIPDLPLTTLGEHPILIGPGRLNVKMQTQRVRGQ